MNEQGVLRTIRALGPLSRIEIARQMGITAPTAAKAVDSLLQRGWLEEIGTSLLLEPGRGRPGRKVNIPPGEVAQVIGVVLDARQCRIVSASLSGHLRNSKTMVIETPDKYDVLISRIINAVQKLREETTSKVFGLGITVPGLIDDKSHTGILSPNLPITNGRSPVQDIQAFFDFPCVQVQEVHALCLAERAFGAARGLQDFAMLDVSTGVGLGVVLGGQLLTGHRGLAGELGHITAVPFDGRLCGCGNLGCLETEASDTALSSAIAKRIGHPIRWAEMANLTVSVEAEVERCSQFLAIAVATVINLFNVSTLFVHGEMFAAFPELFPRLLSNTKRRALAPSFADCTIIRTQGSKRLGAIAGILEHLIDSLAPMQFPR